MVRGSPQSSSALFDPVDDKQRLRQGGVGEGHDGGIVGKVVQRRTEGLFKQMNEHLADHDYLAGDEFTLADLMTGFAVTTMPALTGSNTNESLTNIKRYAERLTQRPAWRKATEIAGPQATRPE